MQVITTVMERRSVAIRIAKEVKEKRDLMLKSRICLVCEEPMQPGMSRRGECPACRQYTRRLVDRGIKTEEQLIREGKMTEIDLTPTGKSRKAHAKRLALLD